MPLKPSPLHILLQICVRNVRQVKPQKCDIHPAGVSMICQTAAMPSWKPAASWIKCQRVEGKPGAHILRKAEYL